MLVWSWLTLDSLQISAEWLFLFVFFFLSLKSDVAYGFLSFVSEPSFIIIAGQFISRHKINFTGIRVTEN